MLPIGIILGFLGYDIGTWGYILVKGYNITLREWSSPFHPFTGPLDGNGKVPKGWLFPTTSGPSSGDTSTPATHPLDPQQKAGRNALRTRGRPPVQ